MHQFADNVDPLWVICLCAQWCGTCREYQSTFHQLQQQFHKGARFVWLDVEDRADVLEPIDIDDFPTVMIARNNRVLFFGPLTPQRDRLARLIQSHLADGAPSESIRMLPAEVHDLFLRIASA